MTAREAPAPAVGEVGDRVEAVAALVERARRDIPFYRDRLAAAPPVPTGLHELPSSTKADLQGYGRFPLTAGSPAGAARIAATSGTTGSRLFMAFSPADWQRIGDTLERRAAVVGLGAGDLLCNTHGHGLWIGGPTLDLMAERAGAGLLPCGPGNTASLLDWLEELPVTALSATPSYLRHLVERAGSGGHDLGAWSLRLGLLGGEGAGVPLRQAVQEAFGSDFRWQELYGSTEVGGPILGFSPPDDPLAGRLLLDTDEMVVELLALDADEAVRPGEVGEITVTTPFREMSPLIRYRTRDLAAQVEGPPHPSGLPVVTSLLGRVDDALKVRGALVYPSVVEDLLVRECPAGAEWRVEVTRPPAGLDVLTVRVEHDDPAAAVRIRDLLQEHIALKPVIEVVAVGTLERFEGKARRVVDHRT